MEVDSSSMNVSQSGTSISTQAPALPVKRGEIGYDASAFNGSESRPGEVDLSSGVADVLNGPHPAERPSTSSSPSLAPSPSSPPSTTATKRSRTRTLFWTLRSSKPNKRLGGLCNATILRLISVFLCIAGVIALWAFTIKILNSTANASPQSQDDNASGVMPSFVFVHIAFTLAVCILLVFFERVIYQARVERFAFKNPGSSLLPRFRGEGSTEAIPYAPWNRSPLPTYAAAMNVAGTGDVEDEVIAAPPPPAYGNTRGSTLLLSGIPSLRSSESGGTLAAGQQVPDLPSSRRDDDEDRRSMRSTGSRRVVSLSESIRSFIMRNSRASSLDLEDVEETKVATEQDIATSASRPSSSTTSSS